MSDRNGIIRLPNPTGLPTARGAVGTPLGIIKAPDRRGFRPGRMRVLLTLHGGENALASVMAGLVERNARAIRNGQIPDNPNAVQNKLTYSREPVWLDGPSALAQGRCTAGTLAAWEAAGLVTRGRAPDATVGYVEGVPVVLGSVGGTVISDPSVRFGRRLGDNPGAVGAIPGDPDEGRVNEFLVLLIDDPEGTPVREIGDRIARHNARRIAKYSLPDIYSSGVVYETEGSPEKWWDVEEILRAGHDDCEGLAAYVAGWHINQGREAGVWTRMVTGPADSMGGGGGRRLFHAVARVRDPVSGQWYIDDPSAALGMTVPRWYLEHARQARARGEDI